MLRIWRAMVTVTDDRNPAPRLDPPKDWVEAPSATTVQVDATDCGGNQVSETFRAPDLSEFELSTFTNVDPNSMPTPEVPPAAEAVEKIYSGKTFIFSRLESNPPGPWECKTDTDLVEETYLFPGDGTMIMTKLNGEVLEGEYRRVFQQDTSNNQRYYYYKD